MKASFMVIGNLVTKIHEIADGFNILPSKAHKINAEVTSSTLNHANPNTLETEFNNF